MSARGNPTNQSNRDAEQPSSSGAQGKKKEQSADVNNSAGTSKPSQTEGTKATAETNKPDEAASNPAANKPAEKDSGSNYADASEWNDK